MTITAQSNSSSCCPPVNIESCLLNNCLRFSEHTTWSLYLATFLPSEEAINLFWDLVLYYLLMAVSGQQCSLCADDDGGAEVGSVSAIVTESPAFIRIKKYKDIALQRYSVTRQRGLLIRRRGWQTQHQMMTLNFRDIVRVRAGMEAVCGGWSIFHKMLSICIMTGALHNFLRKPKFCFALNIN